MTFLTAEEDPSTVLALEEGSQACEMQIPLSAVIVRVNDMPVFEHQATLQLIQEVKASLAGSERFSITVRVPETEEAAAAAAALPHFEGETTPSPRNGANEAAAAAIGDAIGIGMGVAAAVGGGALAVGVGASTAASGTAQQNKEVVPFAITTVATHKNEEAPVTVTTPAAAAVQNEETPVAVTTPAVLEDDDAAFAVNDEASAVTTTVEFAAGPIGMTIDRSPHDNGPSIVSLIEGSGQADGTGIEKRSAIVAVNGTPVLEHVATLQLIKEAQTSLVGTERFSITFRPPPKDPVVVAPPTDVKHIEPSVTTNDDGTVTTTVCFGPGYLGLKIGEAKVGGGPSIVTALMENTQAVGKGIRVGSTIVAVNGEPVFEHAATQKRIHYWKGCLQGGGSFAIAFRLALPKERTVTFLPGTDLGMEVGQATPEGPSVIMAVQDGGQAERFDIPTGSVIVQVMDTPVNEHTHTLALMMEVNANFQRSSEEQPGAAVKDDGNRGDGDGDARSSGTMGNNGGKGPASLRLILELPVAHIVHRERVRRASEVASWPTGASLSTGHKGDSRTPTTRSSSARSLSSSARGTSNRSRKAQNSSRSLRESLSARRGGLLSPVVQALTTSSKGSTSKQRVPLHASMEHTPAVLYPKSATNVMMVEKHHRMSKLHLYIACEEMYVEVVRYLASSSSARLTQLDHGIWRNPHVLAALVQGCQDRLRHVLPPLLEDALVLPPGQGGLEPVLLPLLLEYALPVTWEDVQEVLC